MSLVNRWRSNQSSRAIYDINEMPVFVFDDSISGASLVFRTTADQSLVTGSPPPGWAAIDNYGDFFNNSGGQWAADTWYNIASGSGSGCISTIIGPEFTVDVPGESFLVEITIDSVVYLLSMTRPAVGINVRPIVGSFIPKMTPFTSTATYASEHVDGNDARYPGNANGINTSAATGAPQTPAKIIIPVTEDAKRLNLPFLRFRQSFAVRMRSPAIIPNATQGDVYAGVVWGLDKFVRQ